MNTDLTDYDPDETYNEPAHDIAAVIACEVATDWGLDLADPMTRIATWAWIEQQAHDNVCRALGETPVIDWALVAQATHTPHPEQHWMPEPLF